jgi:alpha-1,2-mannosyltransferase
VTSARVDLVVAVAFCAVLGLYDVLYVVFTLSGGPRIGSSLAVLFPDFLVFYAAVHAWIEGKASLIYDVDAFTHYQNILYVDRFDGDRHFRPFFYPPTWLLMLLPLGLLGVAKAYAAFMAGTAVLATALRGWRDGWGWLAVLTSPAAAWVVLTGQNTFLSVAFFYGGFGLLERMPIIAGILLGLLSYKPQLWLLVPLALLAARQWTALAAMIVTIVLLSLASLGVFGLDFWMAFVDAAREANSARVMEEMIARVYMHMTSLVAAARIVGLSPDVANAIQWAGTLVAAGAVWIAFRRHGGSEARTAVLAAATFLVSPYTLNYDLLLLMPAIVALFRLGAARGFRPAERAIMLVLWLLPTLGMVANRLAFPVMPLVILLFGVTAWSRLGDTSKVELPEAAAAR